MVHHIYHMYPTTSDRIVIWNILYVQREYANTRTLLCYNIQSYMAPGFVEGIGVRKYFNRNVAIKLQQEGTTEVCKVCLQN